MPVISFPKNTPDRYSDQFDSVASFDKTNVWRRSGIEIVSVLFEAERYLACMDDSLIYKIACWSNGIALIIFLGIEIFWFVEESKKLKDALPLAVTFVLYNLPFFLLGLSLYFQPIPTAWPVFCAWCFYCFAFPSICGCIIMAITVVTQ